MGQILNPNEEGDVFAPLDTKRMLTHFAPAHTRMMGSGYGQVTNLEWCRRERDRMNRNDDTVLIVHDGRGNVALQRRLPKAKAIQYHASDDPGWRSPHR